MKKIILIFTALPLLALPAFAQAAITTIDIKVNGMVCDFCAQAVWKVFEDYAEVDKVDIDLDTGIVEIKLKLGQSLDDERIQKGITYAGYDLVSVEKRQN